MSKGRLPKKHRPVGLYLFCNHHKAYYRDDTKVKCKCADIIYKAKIHVPGTQNESRTKSFAADDFDSALELFQAFKLELKRTSFMAEEKTPVEIIPVYLTDCMDKFMAYLRNEGVPEHAQKVRSIRVLRHYERSLNYLLYSLIENNIDPKRFRFSSINEEIVGMVFKFLLETKALRNKSFNNYMSDLKKFEKYVNDRYNLNRKLYFREVRKRKVVSDIKSVTIEEFLNLLKLVNYENGWIYEKRQTKGGRRRNLYRPWMVTAFKLGLLTGGRREEVVNFKWNGIRQNHKGVLTYIEITHYKLNKAHSHIVSAREFEIKRIPINKDLEDFLYELGYSEHKGKDQFILAPESPSSRDDMMEVITNSFSHYFKQLGTGETKTFKHLRKTHMTALYLAHGINAHKASGHEGIDVMLKHYIDPKVVMDEMQESLKLKGRILNNDEDKSENSDQDKDGNSDKEKNKNNEPDEGENDDEDE